MRRIASLLTILLGLAPAAAAAETGRLLAMELPQGAGTVLSLRKASLEILPGLRLESNPLADGLLLANLGAKTTLLDGAGLALACGASGFVYLGDAVARRLASQGGIDVLALRSDFAGVRLWATAAWTPASALLAGAGLRILAAAGDLRAEVALGLRVRPAAWLAVLAEAGFDAAAGRAKAALGVEIRAGAFFLQAGAWFNPVNDPALSLPVVPTVDVGVAF